MSIKWVGEIGTNHNKSPIRITNLLNAAKEVGCDAVKFQYFKADQLYAPEFKNKISKMKKWELPYGFLPEIARQCKELDLKFGCSVFDLQGVQAIKPFVDFFKIGSYELLWTDLIQAVALTGKPWMISTGMASMQEIENGNYGNSLEQVKKEMKL